VQRRLRHVLAQPVTALRQRLRLAVDAADLRLLAVGQQVVVHADADLGTDPDLRHADEHVERVGHPPVGRVLQRHDAEIDVLAVHFLEDGGDVADRHEVHRLAEARQRGEVAEAVLRPEERHLEHPLQRPRAGDQFAVDGANRRLPEGAIVALEDVLDHFLFPGGGEDALAVLVLDLADLRREVRPLVDEFEDLQVELIDLSSVRLEVLRRRRPFRGWGGTGLGLACHRISLWRRLEKKLCN